MEKRSDGPGMSIGEVDDELAGVVLSSVAGQFTVGPPALAPTLPRGPA
ncbi:hypothetical protein [Pauljensenia sp. OF14-1SRA]|nr:hypothetical protein [Pauljensenia sp. OF14-1SRA]